MKRLIAMCACAMWMTGCLADDTRLADLSESERERVCKRANYEEQTCEDGTEYDSFTESECNEQLDRLAGSDCIATVGDLEAVTDDPCSDEAKRARAVIFTFDCIFAR